MKKQLDFIPQPLMLWAPPLAGISAMLLLGYGFEIARYFLFGHHLFWIIAIILLINPLAETFWSAKPKHGKQPASHRSASSALRWSKQREPGVQQHPAPATETPTERLARLQRQMGGVDREIEMLQSRSQGPVKQKNG